MRLGLNLGSFFPQSIPLPRKLAMQTFNPAPNSNPTLYNTNSGFNILTLTPSPSVNSLTVTLYLGADVLEANVRPALLTTQSMAHPNSLWRRT